MRKVEGTAGYKSSTQNFITATLAIDFLELHEPFLNFIPKRPSRMLDVGAGVGRDAFVLANMGHKVTAIEPTAEYLAAAKELHNSSYIEWIYDSLPELATLSDTSDPFDFILVSAVWHHLDETQRLQATVRLAGLMKPGSVFALSLRHGPAGLGTHVFPINDSKTIEVANSCGLRTLFNLPNQPSLMPEKKEVSWTFLVFSKARD